MHLKRYIIPLIMCLMAALNAPSAQAATAPDGPEIVVYVPSWSDQLPDPSSVTCINYAFGHVNATFNGVTIDNEPLLRQILELKKANRKLKVVLSIGGWGSDGFSQMAADAHNRRMFAWDCRKIVWSMGIDGIDIDWEYPTQGDAGIAFSPDDTQNLTKVVQELRTAIGPKRTISVATVSSGLYVNLRALSKYVDYFNLMTYDMGTPPSHNAPLFQSKYVQSISIDEAVQRILNQGIPGSQIVLGLPFYGHASENFPTDVKNSEAHLVENFFYNWDEDAKVPYMTTRSGQMAYSFDDVRSLGIKCSYARNRKLRGVMCWSYDGDDPENTLLNAVNSAMKSAEILNLDELSDHVSD